MDYVGVLVVATTTSVETKAHAHVRTLTGSTATTIVLNWIHSLFFKAKLQLLYFGILLQRRYFQSY